MGGKEIQAGSVVDPVDIAEVKFPYISARHRGFGRHQFDFFCLVIGGIGIDRNKNYGANAENDPDYKKKSIYNSYLVISLQDDRPFQYA
jgi:hypothetical protein